jgi:MFS family permease
MKRVVVLFYGFQFFFSALWWLPVFYEYQKLIGLSDPEIFEIQSIYYIAFCLLEIPTGVFADRVGHRRSMHLGAVVLVIANLLPIFAQNYTGFMAHFLFIALSRSLISGASSAYIYEYLHRHSTLDYYKQIEGRARAYSLLGKVALWAAIGPLMEWHLTLPYWLTTGSAIIAVAISCFLPGFHEEAPPEPDGGELWVHTWNRLGERFWGLFTRLRASPYLVFLMLQGIGIFVLSRVCQVNLYQPIMNDKGFSLASFGLVMSLMTVFEAIGSYKPDWLRRYLSDLNAVYILTAVMAMSLGLIAFSGWIATLILFCLFSLAAGLSFPIQRKLVNDAIPDSQYRATLLSVESIVDRAANAWIAMLIGSYLADGRLNDFLLFSNALAMAVIFILFIIGLTPMIQKRTT